MYTLWEKLTFGEKIYFVVEKYENAKLNIFMGLKYQSENSIDVRNALHLYTYGTFQLKLTDFACFGMQLYQLF